MSGGRHDVTEQVVHRSAEDGGRWVEGSELARSAALPEGVAVTRVHRVASHGGAELCERRPVDALRCWGAQGPAEAFESWLATNDADGTGGEVVVERRCDELLLRVRLYGDALVALVEEVRVLHRDLEGRHRGSSDAALGDEYASSGLAAVEELLEALCEQVHAAVQGWGPPAWPPVTSGSAADGRTG